jgi:hypothetical protein
LTPPLHGREHGARRWFGARLEVVMKRWIALLTGWLLLGCAAVGPALPVQTGGDVFR